VTCAFSYRVPNVCNRETSYCANDKKKKGEKQNPKKYERIARRRACGLVVIYIIYIIVLAVLHEFTDIILDYIVHAALVIIVIITIIIYHIVVVILYPAERQIRGRGVVRLLIKKKKKRIILLS